MAWFIACLAVVVLGFAAVATSGSFGQFGPFTIDRTPLVLPSEPLTPKDLDAIHFQVVPRGYAMDQVDQFMEYLHGQLPETVLTSGESGIIEDNELRDRRNHNGSDETSYR